MEQCSVYSLLPTYAIVQCVYSLLPTHATVQCVYSLLPTHATVQCVYSLLLTHVTLQCVYSLLPTHATVQCVQSASHTCRLCVIWRTFSAKYSFVLEIGWFPYSQPLPSPPPGSSINQSVKGSRAPEVNLGNLVCTATKHEIEPPLRKPRRTLLESPQ